MERERLHRRRGAVDRRSRRTRLLPRTQGRAVPAFSGLLIVVAVAFVAPLLPLRVPAVIVEIVLGIIIGPSLLGWVHLDETISVVAILGLAFLLFLAGLEIDLDRLRGRALRLTLAGFALSLAIAVPVAAVLDVGSPLLVAITLSATSLGVIIPVLKDSGEIGSDLGQLVVAAGSIADFGAIILLSVFFSGEGGPGSTL